MPDILDRLFADLATTDLPVPPAASVIARGRQRRRRARGQLVGAVAAAAIVVVGVAQLPSMRAGSHPSGHRETPSAVCPAAPDTALRTELTSQLPMSWQLVTPIAVSPDGKTIYVETSMPSFHGIAEESAATGHVLVEIDALAAKFSNAAGGLSPGGDLFWTTNYSTYGGQGYPFTPVRMWSPRDRTVTTLEPPGQHGAALSAPVLDPGHDLAAWEQSAGNKQEIVEANLAARSVVVIAAGTLGAPAYVGNALVWFKASGANGEHARLVAVAAGSAGRMPVPVPLQLRGANGGSLGSDSPGSPSIGLIASNGYATAYTSADLTELFYSPSPSERARLVLRLRSGDTFTPGSLFVGAGYLGWQTAYATGYLASTKTLAAAEVVNGTTTWGGSYESGPYVLVETFAPTKKVHLSHWHLVSGSTVNALRCAPVRRAKH